MNELQKRIEKLKREHRALDEKIYEMYRNYAEDQDVDNMKMKKLRLKREIVWLEKRIESLNV